MHAVVITVTVNDREQAVAALRDQVVPRVSSMPGSVAGYWTDLGGNRGTSMVVWESEEAARQAADQAEAPGSFVTFDSVEVAEVVASA